MRGGPPLSGAPVLSGGLRTEAGAQPRCVRLTRSGTWGRGCVLVGLLDLGHTAQNPDFRLCARRSEPSSEGPARPLCPDPAEMSHQGGLRGGVVPVAGPALWEGSGVPHVSSSFCCSCSWLERLTKRVLLKCTLRVYCC